ncbi:MAG: ABC transporter substrate-binding protein [Anaerolineae bacterium]|nr:ABC transporter substrate-binding protein [Anaerolineae bacterium]MDW8067925.1 ABC transporter substrate-binding protein [Anaerolineae bacterium]
MSPEAGAEGRPLCPATCAMRCAMGSLPWAFCALIALFLAACVAVTPSPPAHEPLRALTPVPSPAPVRELRLLLPEWPRTLSPFRARSWSERALQDLFLVGLWRVDDRLGVAPELAAELPSRANGGISAEGRVLTVRLRENLFWSDGTPLTANDLVFTHEQAAERGIFPHASFVEAVMALDSRTVQVTFSRPFAPWPTMLFPFVLPRHAPDSPGRVSNGPYVFVGEEGGALVFVANPHCWRGLPAVERVRVFAQPDARARWQVMAFGHADLAPFLAPEGLPGLEPPEGMRLLFSPSGYVETLFFNLDPRRGHPALQEARIRAALAIALDRESVCTALPARAVPAESLYSGTVWESPAPPSIPSVRRAAQMLDEVGWRDTDGDGVREREGVSLRLRYAAPPGREAALAAMTQTLRPLGIVVETAIREHPWEDPAAWDLAQWAGQSSGYPDPDDARWLCAEARPGGQNPAGVCDEALDELWLAQAAATDPDERAAILAEIQEEARQKVWWMPLCRWEDAWLVRSDLSGPRPWRGAPFWNIGEWSIAP